MTLLSDAKNRLKKSIHYEKEIPIGIMIETPATVISARLFARNCDFFSIGTNDLIQYITCTDRTNPQVQYLHTPYTLLS